jgi:putative transposase
MRVARELDQLIAARGRPLTIVSGLRDELLNETLFRSLPHARDALENWRRDYNTNRPHSRLGWQTPADYAATFTPAAQAASTRRTPLRLHPLAQPASSGLCDR